MTSARPLALWAMLVPAVGCAEQAPLENRQTSSAAIIDGEVSGSDQDGVLLLRARLDRGEVLCSASLIGPNLIITARHCVSYYTDGLFSCSVQGELTDSIGNAGELGLHLPAANLEVYGGKKPRKLLARGQRVLSTLSPSVCTNDLAFVVLDQDVAFPVVPLRLDRPAQRDEVVTLVGYGLDGQQQAIDVQSAVRHQKTLLKLAGVGPDSVADGVSDVPPRTLILQGISGCVGDSGGPLLAASSGALLGVYSLQRGEACTDPDVVHQLVHVEPFHNLINDAFAAAGVEPIAEPVNLPDAGGDSDAGRDAGSPNGGAAGDASRDPVSAAGAPASPSEPEPPHAARPSSSCGFTPAHRSAQDALLLLAMLAPLLRPRRRRFETSDVSRC
jgi:hypothetical protein